jgi:hypothetical protein
VLARWITPVTCDEIAIIALLSVGNLRDAIAAEFDRTLRTTIAVIITVAAPFSSAFKIRRAWLAIGTGRTIAGFIRINHAVTTSREATVRTTRIWSDVTIPPSAITLFIIRTREEGLIRFINDTIKIIIDLSFSRKVIRPIGINDPITAEFEHACGRASIKGIGIPVVTFFVTLFPSISADDGLALVIAPIARFLHALLAYRETGARSTIRIGLTLPAT